MKDKVYTNEKVGYCPICDGFNLEYEKHVLDCGFMYFPFTCKECKAEGKEYYNVDYSETDAWKK